MTAAALSTDAVRAVLHGLPGLADARDDAERVDRLRLFEELKAALAAAQALEAVALDEARRAEHAAAAVPRSRQGAGVAGEVALAMRMSPYRAQRWLGWAKIMTSELPATFAALQAGRTTEWRTMLVARETAVLSRRHRAAVDRELAPRLEAWGDRRTADEARKAGYRLDPASSVARASNAVADRGVSIRPAPDTMCRLSALLPVDQGVAAFATLRRDAAALAGHGDETRSQSQLMADLLVQRLTGQVTASGAAIELELIMTDQSLLGAGEGRNAPAHLVGHGPIPAGLARDLATAPDVRRWVRRLYTAPHTGQLVAMDSRRRTFPPALRRFLRLRDQRCRVPFCDAPIRHADHVVPHELGGPTSAANGAGLSETCNYTKQAPGWRSRAAPDGDIEITTPTGHRYRSRAPDPPGAGRARRRRPAFPDYSWPRAA